MRINTNVSALNAQRQLGITNTAVSQSITRLSSGFRINRAADDAAGLGIANKLRGDIRSMTQAARNGEQANSLAQIAEGSASGIAKMLDRMKELATQSNSDTVDTAGRARLDEEFSALRDEISRTAATTQFGTTKLLNGRLGGVEGALSATITGAGTPTVGADVAVGSHAFGTVVAGGAGVVTRTVDLTVNGTVLTSNVINVGDNTTITSGGAQTLTFGSGTSAISITLATGTDLADFGGETLDVTGVGGNFMVGSSGAYSTGGTTGDLLTFSAINLTTNASGLNIEGLDLSSAANSQTALARLDTAVNSVNQELGKIGAFQNRIENAVANLKTTIENLSASESVIRDLDMASEMTTFSKNQILQQAGTAMLAQANQSSQGILQLLRG